jgi:hypothetical protein
MYVVDKQQLTVEDDTKVGTLVEGVTRVLG